MVFLPKSIMVGGSGMFKSGIFLGRKYLLDKRV